MNISVKNDGYVLCKSNFYSANDLLSNSNYLITSGVNKLIGEIDSGVWAISYLLSMYKYRQKDFVLFEEPIVTVDETKMSLAQFSTHSCYMDTLYPLFNRKSTVEKLVIGGINTNNLDFTPDSIRDLFCIDKEKFNRPLSGTGDEVFKAMAAIGYVNGKDVYCFPWLSYKRYCSYHQQLERLIKILDGLNKVVILPIGREP